jgi:four helix bundle protein
MRENDLKERLFEFAVGVLKMLRSIDQGREIEVLKYQLSKSATSAGANYEESQAAISKAEFSSKVSISLKEMRESNYWLRILANLYPSNTEITELTRESQELKKIPGSISYKVSPRSKEI